MMNKLLHIVITLGAAVIAVVLWLLAGTPFMKMQAGPEVLKPEEHFGDAKGAYISYEAAYPVASWVEEYYSGDEDRVSTNGYVVYDADREAFVCVLVPERSDLEFDSLLRGMELAAEIRANKDMTPITVIGSLELASQERADQAQKILEESKIIEQYSDFQDSDAYMKAYFENDEYGRVLANMCEDVLNGQRQSEWYILEQGSIHNLRMGDIKICIVTALLNLLIFLFCLIGLFRGSKQYGAELSVGSGSPFDRFLAEQRVCAEKWCTYNLKRGYRLATLCLVIPVALFIGMAIFAKTQDRMMTFSVPIGLLIGEILALIMWWSQKSQSKPNKLLKRLEKSLAKEFSSDTARNEFIEEYVNTQQQWAFGEKTSNGMLWGKVGERYCSVFLWTGRVTVIDMARLKEVETETRSGSVQSGKVKVNYVNYVAQFYYQEDQPRRKCDKTVYFDIEDSIGFFITLIRKRVGDRVRITSK